MVYHERRTGVEKTQGSQDVPGGVHQLAGYSPVLALHVSLLGQRNL